MQNYWTSIFNVNGDSLPGPLIIGTFEKRAPGEVEVREGKRKEREVGVLKGWEVEETGRIYVKRLKI